MRILKSFLLSLIPIILGYLGASFIVMDFNPNNYAIEGRAILSIFGILFSIAVYLIAYYDIFNKNKQL